MKNCASMNQFVLVLNKYSMPLEVVPTRDAIEKLCNLGEEGTQHQVVKVLDVTDDEYSYYDLDEWIKNGKSEYYINSQYYTIPVPEIIILTDTDHKPSSNKVGYSKRRVKERDGYRCSYCNKLVKSTELTIDHIVPTSKGGKKTDYLNVTSACGDCNSKKGDMYLKDTDLVLQNSPSVPQFTMIIGVPKSKQKKSWEVFIK
jgi:5-methylcytosine-specific restriction endonuclease McrA